MDQAKLARVPPRTATLVVGNPLIADVSVQAGGAMVITGKGYGVTNLIALDPNGRKIYEKLVRVQGPAENVVVYRGTTRESYICEPNCERRITLGDTPDYFDTNSTRARPAAAARCRGRRPRPVRADRRAARFLTKALSARLEIERWVNPSDNAL